MFQIDPTLRMLQGCLPPEPMPPKPSRFRRATIAQLGAPVQGSFATLADARNATSSPMRVGRFLLTEQFNKCIKKADQNVRCRSPLSFVGLVVLKKTCAMPPHCHRPDGRWHFFALCCASASSALARSLSGQNDQAIERTTRDLRWRVLHLQAL
jgi:hypothetical protein